MLLDEYQGYYTDSVDREELLKVAESLPAMPSVASRALQMISDPKVAAQELAAILSKDAGLATRLLRMANSAFFSQRQEITSLEQAISVIGVSSLRSLVMASVMRGLKEKFGPYEQLVWQNSIATVITARIAAKQLRSKLSEELFLSGLLHKLGQLVFLTHPECAARYVAVMQAVKEQGADFATAELETIGFSYPLIGALGANRWGLPKDISYVILHHNDPFEGIDSKEDEMAAFINLSRFLASQAEVGYTQGLAVDTDMAEAIARALGIESRKIAQTFEDITQEVKESFAREMQAFKF